VTPRVEDDRHALGGRADIEVREVGAIAREEGGLARARHLVQEAPLVRGYRLGGLTMHLNAMDPTPPCQVAAQDGRPHG
jgi:hypothetical protein